MQNLRKLRKGLGITQRELSERLGIPAPTLGLYEQCRREPTISTMIAIADFFGVSLDALVGHEKPENKPITILSSEEVHILECADPEYIPQSHMKILHDAVEIIRDDMKGE